MCDCVPRYRGAGVRAHVCARSEVWMYFFFVLVQYLQFGRFVAASAAVMGARVSAHSCPFTLFSFFVAVALYPLEVINVF